MIDLLIMQLNFSNLYNKIKTRFQDESTLQIVLF